MTPAHPDDRVRLLYEVSAIVAGFEGEQTFPAILSATARALPVRTVTLVLEQRGVLSCHAWKAEDLPQDRSEAALDRARDAYAWFNGGARSSSPTAKRFVALPLLVERGRVFGVLQVEPESSLVEGDVFFVNAAANLLALAVARRLAAADAQARIQAQLYFTRGVTDSLGEGLLAVDTDACITFLNPAAEKLLGWKEGEVLGSHAPEVIRVQRADGKMLDPADCPLVLALATDALVGSDEQSFLGRDGVPVPVSYTAAPMRNEGRVWGAVVVFRDVIAVKRSERTQRLFASVSAALAESHDYTSAVDAVVSGVVPAFADHCFIEEAPAERSHSQFRIVVPLSVRGRTFGVLTLAMLESGRHFAADDFELADELGRRAATAFDNVRLHRALQAAVRDREDILAVVSHDLRIPLNTVSMAAATLLNRSPELDPRKGDRRALEMIERAGKRMERMTNDLLDVSSIDAGHLAVNAAPTMARTLISDVLEAMTPSAAARGVQLIAAATSIESALEVRCDRDRILQVLSNLVGNAIKFTPAGGRIDVLVEAAEEFARFVVSDTGPGIATDLVPHVFDRYRQAMETASKGRGLGLFITKGIVEAHGGSVGVDTVLGSGTAFYFVLPRVPPLDATLKHTS